MSDTTSQMLLTVANTGRVLVAPTFNRTDSFSWLRPLNPKVGMSESEWLEQNRDGLTSFMGRWIAILGDQIITSGDSASEVYEYLKARNIRDTLITFVQEIPNKWGNLIA